MRPRSFAVPTQIIKKSQAVRWVTKTSKANSQTKPKSPKHSKTSNLKCLQHWTPPVTPTANQANRTSQQNKSVSCFFHKILTTRLKVPRKASPEVPWRWGAAEILQIHHVTKAWCIPIFVTLICLMPPLQSTEAEQLILGPQKARAQTNTWI